MSKKPEQLKVNKEASTAAPKSPSLQIFSPSSPSKHTDSDIVKSPISVSYSLESNSSKKVNQKKADFEGVNSGLAFEVARSTSLRDQNQPNSLRDRAGDYWEAIGIWLRQRGRVFWALFGLFMLLLLFIIVAASLYSAWYRGMPNLWIAGAKFNVNCD